MSDDYTDAQVKELERFYRRGMSDEGDDYDPLSDQQLWRHIKYLAGGIRRNRKYWDSNLSLRENRAAYRYLDRGWEKGRPMDTLAQEIGMAWPYFGIEHEEDLWAWMQRTRKC